MRNPPLLQESGDFLSEVKRLEELAIAKDSHLYQPPTRSELAKFERLAQAFITQDQEETLRRAHELQYELVEFTDVSSQQVLYGLREKQLRRQPLRGWGSFFINPAHQTNALVEIPHVIADQFSANIGAVAFLSALAHGFLMAGAHRDANGLGTADVCNPVASVFQKFHEAWLATQAVTWQVHGFQRSQHPWFPKNTDTVLSNGQGVITPQILELHQHLESEEIHTYVYNQLAESDPLNQRVNQKNAGEVFASLGATQNIQGRSCARAGLDFVHIELEKNTRSNSAQRNAVADIIAHSIKATF